MAQAKRLDFCDMWHLLETYRYELLTEEITNEVLIGLFWEESTFENIRELDPNGNNAVGFGQLNTREMWRLIPSLKGQGTVPVAEWIKSVGHDNRVPMYFLYGAKDSTGESFAQRYSGLAKAGTKPGVTGPKAVPDTKLAGPELLTVKSLNVPDLIVQYLEKVTKDNPGGDWDKREVEKNPYVWQMATGLPINAKTEGQKTMLPLPLNRFLR